MTDAHAHLADARLGDPAGVIAQARSTGVDWMLATAAGAGDWAVLLRLSRQFSGVGAAIGLHPWHAAQWTPRLAAELEAVADNPQVVAIGEIGLDNRQDGCAKSRQMACLSEQLAIARRLNLPVILHISKAWTDLAPLVKAGQMPAKGAVWHGFLGSAEVAREAVEAGLFLSFGGRVTYGKNRKCRAAAAWVPADRLLVESDAPDCPAACARERSEVISRPEHVRYVYETLAELRGETVENLIAIVAENVQKLFGGHR